MLPVETEHRINHFFSENIETPQDLVLLEALSLLSRSVDLPYPLTQPPETTSDHFLALVEERIEPMERYRALVVDFCKRYFENDPDIALAAEIAGKISGPLDKIFADQLQGGLDRRPSWELQSPRGSKALREGITQILETDRYADYLMLRNQPLGETLRFIKDKLITASDPHELEEISKHLEMLAKQGYDAGKPVLLLTLSKYFTECPLEANARFFLPFTRHQQGMTKDLVQALWNDVRHTYRTLGREPPDIELPIFIGGVYLLGAGSELIYSTSAERLNASGLVFFPNVTKEQKDLEDLYESLKIPKPIIDNSMFILMIAHELGHLIHRIEDESRTDVLEVIPDLFSLMTALELADHQSALPKQSTRRAIILRALAEFRQQARYRDPEYQASCEYFFTLLNECGITAYQSGELQYIDVSDSKIISMVLKMYFDLEKLCGSRNDHI